ncbi:hypothetical protein [Streptomyces sp. NPDC088816]|uniref:restriction system modified-DNA reader domain-containing protein n=1 Tax=Streptomyces sp. NPDC088816 TaxID=3365906 RepID=UPI003801BDD2
MNIIDYSTRLPAVRHGREGGEQRMDGLLDTLKQCVERLDRYGSLGRRVGEQNTKAGLIEPVLAALGWDVLEPDEVHREYRRRTTDNPVDYALILMRMPRLFIEAKAVGENLDDPRWANQTISYAAVAGVEWVALTNGAEWRVYNAHAPVPVEHKLFRTVRIADDVDAAHELLSLLSKDNMRDNRIQELWRSFFVDREVNLALNDLFASGEPPRELIALLAKRVPKLPHGDLRASLQRVRATFDFPRAGVAPAMPAPPVAPVPAPRPAELSSAESSIPKSRASGQPPLTRSRKIAVSEDERHVGFEEMMAAGRVIPGATLHGDYMGQRHTATVLTSGQIRYQEKVYPSLSAAGRAVKLHVRGRNTPESTLSTDGWDFWRTTDPVCGDEVSLKTLRRRVVHAQRDR